MTDLATQLDAVKRAYRSGVRTLTYEGRTVVYASAEEMREAIASLQAELGIAPTVVGVVRSTKGY
jgi:hypothetical protein